MPAMVSACTDSITRTGRRSALGLAVELDWTTLYLSLQCFGAGAFPIEIAELPLVGLAGHEGVKWILR